MPAIAAAAGGTVIVNVSVSWSLAAMFESLSDTVMVTLETPAVVGVPHTVRSVAQSGAPSASPAGRPLAAYS